ncbi:MAG: SIMPL domain-containing protein [Bacteroidaceae bacterium]|nr:SIMPL domain-containing protein [Bacteroidaceae bacterium]
MEKGNRIIEAAIIALGLVIMGYCLKAGIDNFVNKDRQVTVKGLSENEVPANTVTWPLTFSQQGNDLPSLYQSVNRTRDIIVRFIKDNGLSEDEISFNSPSVYDRTSNMWNENKSPYRYQMTAGITVKTKKVDEVRKASGQIGDLLNQGIAIDEGYINYDFTDFQEMKLKMMQEAIKNAEQAALQFAENSNSRLGGIMQATQGTFSIEDRDDTTPYIKKLRVVTTVTYSLKD